MTRAQRIAIETLKERAMEQHELGEQNPENAVIHNKANVLLLEAADALEEQAG